jgi:hypothetical protein
MIAMFRRIPFASMVLGVLLSACAGSASPRLTADDANRLHRAVQDVTDVIVYDIFSPPQAARVYAYASIAAYEAMRPGHAQYRSLAGQLTGFTPTPAAPEDSVDWTLAGVHAYLTVGRALTFSQQRVDSIRAATDSAFQRAGVSPDVATRSLAYGDTVAKHILAWSKQDGYLETRGAAKYTVRSDEPGRWVPTPPAYMDAVEPNWGRIRPFVIDSATQYRLVEPFAYSVQKGTPFFRELEEVLATSRSLTEEQRNIAAFWDCNPFVMHVQGHTMFATKKISPGGHWMGIVAIAARQARSDVMRSAEAYALTSIALADGFLTAWDEKYRSNKIRPETVINRTLDENWQPLLQTPPFPEYPSGHSVISQAAAAVLTDLYGDGFAFTDSSEVTYGLPARSFVSFRAAADEAAISRLYGGIHFRQAIEEGSKAGRLVGGAVVAELTTRGPAGKANVAPRPRSAP